MSQQEAGEGTVHPNGDDTIVKTTVTKTPEELAKIAEDQRKRAEKAEADKKEALRVADEAKREAADLKAQLEAKADDKGVVSNANIVKIAEEFDVDPKFAEALAAAIATENESKIKKAREELEAQIAKRDQADKQKAFNEAFDQAFTKATQGIKTTVNKDAVKTVFLERVKANEELTVEDVVLDMYGQSGKASSEDDVRGGGEGDGLEIDFATASRDAKKLKAIMADPVAKQKYYSWRDKQGL